MTSLWSCFLIKKQLYQYLWISRILFVSIAEKLNLQHLWHQCQRCCIVSKWFQYGFPQWFQDGLGRFVWFQYGMKSCFFITFWQQCQKVNNVFCNYMIVIKHYWSTVNMISKLLMFAIKWFAKTAFSEIVKGDADHFRQRCRKRLYESEAATLPYPINNRNRISPD